jgi:hypothetical protein
VARFLHPPVQLSGTLNRFPDCVLHFLKLRCTPAGIRVRLALHGLPPATITSRGACLDSSRRARKDGKGLPTAVDDFPSAPTVRGHYAQGSFSSFPSSRWDWRSVHLSSFGGAVTRLLEHSALSDALGGLSDSLLHFLKVGITPASVQVGFALHGLAGGLDDVLRRAACRRRKAASAGRRMTPGPKHLT